MHTTSTLCQQLRELGIPVGATLMVHVSMRKVGTVEGGADALCDALLDVLGPEGTLLVVLGADPDGPFDVSTTPVDVEDIGVFAEIFRQRHGVTFADHAAARFGACGRLAEHLLGGMPLHDYHGVGSPLERLTECHGYVLRLGADVDTVTLTHWAEYVADIPDKRRVRLRYERADIGEQWIESLDDTYGIKEWERGEDYFSQILLDYLQEGVVCKGCVGDVEAELIPAHAFVSFAVGWMERELS